MSGRRALRLCPDAVVVPPRMSAYSEASAAVFSRLRGHDAARRGALDRRGLSGRERPRAALRRPPRDRREAQARRPRARRPADHGRRGADEVPGQGGERRRQARRPAPGPAPTASSPSCTRSRSSGSGASGRSRPGGSGASGSRRSAQVAGLPEDALVTVLGRAAGRHLHALAHNRDPRRVRTRRRRGSIGSQRALGRSRRSPESVDAVLVGLADRVTRRLRTASRVGRTVVLRLRFDDFARATRSHTLPRATAESQAVLAAAQRASCGRGADDRAPRPDAGRPLGRQPRGRSGRPAHPAVPAPALARARRGPRRGSRPLRGERRHPRGAARPRPGDRDAPPSGLGGLGLVRVDRLADALLPPGAPRLPPGSEQAGKGAVERRALLGGRLRPPRELHGAKTKGSRRPLR